MKNEVNDYVRANGAKRATYAIPNVPATLPLAMKSLKALWSQRAGVSLRTWEVLERLVNDALAKERGSQGESGATHNGIE